MKFVSDESEVSKGFALRYTAIEKPKNQAKVVGECHFICYCSQGAAKQGQIL